MFGLSGGKILLLAIVIGVVWYFWRWKHRYGELRERSPWARDPDADRRRRAEPPPLDLVRNPETGAYEPRREDDGRDRR